MYKDYSLGESVLAQLLLPSPMRKTVFECGVF